MHKIQMFIQIARGILMPFLCLLLILLAACSTSHQAAAPQAASTAPKTTTAASTNSSAAPISAAAPIAPASADTKPLFDGKTLTGWEITDFAGHGEVKVTDRKLLLGMGVMTGVTYTNPFPKMNYEIELDAMRVDGDDFFCGLTFPVGEKPCSFIVGGWGGGVVGLSSIDGEDAAHNETAKYMQFDKNRWYHIRLRVTPSQIDAWIDKEKMVEFTTTDRSLSIRIEMESCTPLGIATWSTAGAISNIRFRNL
jgi:hypothetical protein